jgi:hypothetical protein
MILCSDHAAALADKPDHYGSWTAGEKVGDDKACDACIRKGLDYAHVAARSRASRGQIKKAA